MQSLYKIASEHLELVDLLEESGGELTEEMQKALIENEAALKSKAESYAAIISQFDDRADIVGAQIKRLQDLKKRNEGAAKRMKAVLQNAMELFNVQKIETEFFKIALQKNPRSVEVYDEKAVPKEYWVTPAAEISKTLIKAALEEGTTVLGAKWSEPKNRLSIK